MRVLVLGGYGFFGSRVVRLLSREAGLDVVVAGRSLDKAHRFINSLGASLAGLSAIQVDAGSVSGLMAVLEVSNPDAVINTCGPFQGKDYRVAEACIKAGCHYVDLADGREFVCGIAALDAEARRKGVLVVSGASSVPGLSGAVVEFLKTGFSRMEEVDVGISPGNRTDRGLATVEAIMSYCGESIPLKMGGRQAFVSGWTSAMRYQYPSPVGRRWLSDCDVPDLALIPQRYPELQTVRFRAGLELSFLHWGTMLFAWLRRMRLVANWSRHAAVIKRVSEWFQHYGSDAGAMHVRVRGRAINGDKVTATWTLVAASGDGPFVPALCSVAIIMRISLGSSEVGAMAAPGVVSLADILTVAEGLAITAETQRTGE